MQRQLKAFLKIESGRPIVLVVLGLLVGGLWLFIEIADAVHEGESRTIDEWLLTSLRNPNDLSIPRGPAWLRDVMRDYTALGGAGVLVLVVMAVAGYLIVAKKYAAMWLCLGATISGIAVGSLLKWFFSRPRPTVVPHLSEVMTASFPSGHSMYSAIVYLTLAALLMRVASGWRTKTYLLAVSLITIGLIGISRVYLGVHYPTDVLAGWTAGICWALLCWLVARFLQHRGTVENGGEGAA